MFSLFSISKKCLKPSSKPNPEHSSFKENDYMLVKMDLLQNFFKALLLALTAVLIPYTVQYFQRDISPQKYIIFGLFALTFIIILIHKKLKRHLDLIVLGYLLLTISLLATAYRNMLPEVNAREGFYMGYAFAMVHRLIGYQVIKTRYMVALYVVSIVVKFPLIPDPDVISNVIVVFLDISTIFLCLLGERADRKQFEIAYKTKIENETYKNLLNSHVSDEIVVFSRDFLTVHYMNEHFKTVSEGSESLKESLDKCKIEGNSFQRHESFFFEIGFSYQDEDQVLSLSDLIICLGKEYNSLKNFEPITLDVVKEIEGNGEENDGDSNIYKVKLFPFQWNNINSIGVSMNRHTASSKSHNTEAFYQRLLSTISSELRTPINAIIGVIEYTKKYINQSVALEYLDQCQNIGKMMLFELNSTYSLGGIRNDKLKIYPDKVSIKDIVDDVYSLYKQQCSYRKINLCIDIDPQVPKRFETDRERLTQILVNLVGNAIKFTIQGGVTIKVRPENSERKRIRFAIEDTGIGLREQDKEMLYKQLNQKKIFKQGRRGLSPQGIGLGLTISNKLIRLLNPTNQEAVQIQFEGSRDKGACFSFTIESLKSNYGDDANISQDSMQEIDESNLAEKMNVYRAPIRQNKTEKLLECEKPCCLVVDDDPFNTFAATKLMEELEYKVKGCFSGQEAIDELRTRKAKSQQPFTVIMMDSEMPVMNGYETTRKLREMMKQGVIDECPIVGILVGEDEQNRILFQEVGVFETLVKPLEKRKLSALFERLNDMKNS